MLRRGETFQSEEGVSRMFNRITSIELNLAVISIKILSSIILCFTNKINKMWKYFFYHLIIIYFYPSFIQGGNRNLRTFVAQFNKKRSLELKIDYVYSARQLLSKGAFNKA